MLKNNNNYLRLKKKFDFLYLKELINSSAFVIYFNCNKISNKALYNLKNEILKKNLKSFTINTKHIDGIFDGCLKFFSSNTFFICCNNVPNFLFTAQLLNNIKFFFFYNKCFNFNYMLNSSSNSLILNNSLNNLHFIIFKLLFNIIIIILFYIINFIKSISNILK
jgi:hypothetical protein